MIYFAISVFAFTAFAVDVDFVYVDFLQLVSRDAPLDADFTPEDMVKHGGTCLNSEARTAFVEMKAALEQAGISGLRLQSAYRAYDYQRAIFDQRVKELVRTGLTRDDAVYKASQSIQHPGASEHQLGLAVDVSINGVLSQSFGETDAGKWLAGNCHHYGYIIRYPQDKVDVTGIIYEPWHLRYVGHPHASIMKRTGYTLEEYLEYLKILRVVF